MALCKHEALQLLVCSLTDIDLQTLYWVQGYKNFEIRMSSVMDNSNVSLTMDDTYLVAVRTDRRAQQWWHLDMAGFYRIAQIVFVLDYHFENDTDGRCSRPTHL